MTGHSKDTQGSSQYLQVMKAMWAAVEEQFKPEKVLAPEGHALIATYALKAAHPELPYVLHFLAMMCALSNGATTTWFPSQTSTLFLAALNVNYAQTRKSSITGNGDSFGDVLDKHIEGEVGKVFDNAKQGLEEEASRKGHPEPRTARPKVTSAVLHSATPTEFFHRCGGDYQQISNLDHVGVPGLDGRHNCGILINPDEIYGLCNAFWLAV